MAQRRTQPYIWVTWLTKLLAGDSACAWSAWFRAHHTEYHKLPPDFDLATWTLEHNELVSARRDQLLEDGCDVFIEDANAFKRVGRTGIVVSGRPDILAIRDGTGVIEDCKTGRPRTSDPLQVLLYMLLLPIKNPRCAGLEISGRVVYRTSAIDVPSDRLSDDFRLRFTEVVHRVGGEKPLPKSPSWAECQWCDIGPSDCLYRVTEPPESMEAETDLF